MLSNLGHGQCTLFICKMGIVSIAIEDIERDGILSENYLQIEFEDTKCDDVYGLGIASQRINMESYSAIIGPQCSSVCRHVGRLAAYHNIACFSGVCQDTEMLDKTKFTTLSRFLGTFDKVGNAVAGLMMAFSWTRVGIIYQYHTDKVWEYTHEAVLSVVEEKGMTVSVSAVYDGSQNITSLLKQVSKASKSETFRSLMTQAYRIGLTRDEYFFVFVYYYANKATFGDISWKQNDDYDTMARLAYRSVLFISYFTPNTSEYQQFTERVKRKSQQMFDYSYHPSEEVPYPAVTLYEAMHGYAISVNMTIADNKDKTDGKIISTRLWNNTFTSVTGNVSLNGNGDREQGYKIEQISFTSSEFHLRVVGYYFSKTGYFEPDSDTKISWPDGEDPPLDRPKCGFDGEYCRTALPLIEVLKIVVGTMGGMLVFVVILSITIPRFVVRKIKQNASESVWKIRESDIVINKKAVFSISKVSITSDTSQTERTKVCTGIFKASIVALKYYKKTEFVSFDVKEFRQIRDLNHMNVAKVIGFCVDGIQYITVTEFCNKGSLMDVLENEDINMDWDFRCCLLWDLLRGLEYIFDSNIRYHGNLKSCNCVIDSRFVLKLTDFGPRDWITNKERCDRDNLWTSPERLRRKQLLSATVTFYQQADIYSLGIIIHEIFQRAGPFGIEDMELQPWGTVYRNEVMRALANSFIGNKSQFIISFTNAKPHTGRFGEIIEKIKDDRFEPFRPKCKDLPYSPRLEILIHKCWDRIPEERPFLRDIKKEFNALSGSNQRNNNFFDNLMKRMEQYATNLEGLVEERTSKYLQEKKRTEDLLHRLLPPSIAYQIQSKGFVEPETYKSVTIMFTDIVQFTDLSAESSPMQIVEMLNDLYSSFDGVINEFNVYKVETIGDAYMCVSGLPERNKYHYLEIANLAVSIMKLIEKFQIRHKPQRKLQLRAGIHSGPCVAGVIGLKMPRYCLFGDTVNTASRMESSCEASRIQLSDSTARLLQYSDLSISSRGEVFIKGKGMMLTFWLEWQQEMIEISKLT